ncbi:MAG: GNAT family N-acetyltransferase [Lachnospiraceae bacterium]|nr:GNAT family N-acetyltransferase [Lachnospiraceae bacterium]
MIRRAQEKDIFDIGRLLHQVCNVHADGRSDLFKHGCRKYSDEELSEIIHDDSRPIFVLIEDGNDTVSGYCFCMIEYYHNDSIMVERKTLYIDDLCVDETARGRHVGKKLYEYVCAYAREIDCYNVTLNVWSCNPGAMHFYEAMGLKPYKVSMEYVL